MRFLQRGTGMHLTIGKRRKKKRTWRKPKGRDNKMRQNRKGRFPIVSIGYKKKAEKRNIKMVHNLNDLEKSGKGDIIILGKIGGKKKAEILKKAMEKKIEIQGINARRFLKKNGPK